MPALLVVIAALSCLPACRQRHPTGAGRAAVKVPRLVRPPRIDGRLDDPAWKGAARMGPFRRSDGRAEARQQTRVLMGWDRGFLYLACDCTDHDIRGHYQNRDDPLYLEEVFEAFLDTDADGRDYLELEVSPNGQTFDAWFSGRRSGRRLDWNPPLQLAVQVTGTLNDSSDSDTGWTVELALPLDSLPGRVRRPAAGVRWRANFFRIDKSGRGGEASSWQATPSGDFHDPAARAVIEFTDQGERP